MRPENAEFEALVARSGWKPAEVARRLQLTPSDVSRYLNGVHPPDKQTLALFKLILSSEQPEALGPVNLQLRDIPPQHIEDLSAAVLELREKFLAVERCARRLQQDAARRKTPPPSSTPDDAAAVGGEQAVASVEKAGVVYGRSRKAASTSGKTSSPASPAGRRSARSVSPFHLSNWRAVGMFGT